MKTYITFIILCLSSFLVAAHASNGSGTKILVFRTSGEIDVFNTDEISRIELSRFDRDSVEHQDYVSQAFFRSDATCTIIPIAEMDSVVFGERNIIETKAHVRRLTAEEVSAIQKIDENSIMYTSGLKLNPYETIYYDEISQQLPYGICAQVNRVENINGQYKADIIYLEPEDVFSRYLITENNPLGQRKTVSKSDYDKRSFNITIPEIEIGGVIANGEISLTAGLTMEDAVVDLLNHYYHGVIKFYFGPNMKFAISSDDSGVINKRGERPLQVKAPLLGKIIEGALNVTWFLDFAAEMGIKYNFDSEMYASVEWTRRDGVDTFGPLVFNHNPVGDIEQKMEIHMNGELFLGALVDLELEVIFDRVGAGTEIKIGPKLEADFSLGALQSLADKYNDEIYGRANVDFSVGAHMTTYMFHREHLYLFGDKVRTQLPFETELFIPVKKIDLFPEFHSRAVMAKDNSAFIKPIDAPDVVSISSYTETDLPYPLDVDFEIADGHSDESLAEIDIDGCLRTPEEFDEPYQNIQGNVPVPPDLPKEKRDWMVARPVINYLGYKIKTKPTDIASDIIFSPIIASMDKNGSRLVSGITPVSQVDYENNTYIEGNIVGILRVDHRFKEKRTFTTVDFVDLPDITDISGVVNPSHPLLGKWSGDLLGKSIVIEFIDERVGIFNGQESFVYWVNSPLKGSVSILLDGGDVITISIIEIDGSRMVIVPGISGDQSYILAKS